MATRAHEDRPAAAPAPPAGAARVVTTGGGAVCERCVLAYSFTRRLRGLLGRRELPAGEGLLLRPCSSVHTWWLRFPIDVVFLDADDRILKVVEGMGPWRMTGARGAKKVLELAAGQAATRDVVVGERLVVDTEGAAS